MRNREHGRIRSFFCPNSRNKNTFDQMKLFFLFIVEALDGRSLSLSQALMLENPPSL